MRCLIQADLSKRYGNLKNGVNDIKRHKWLAEIDWLALYHKKLKPPVVPKLKSQYDTSYFESVAEESIPTSKEMLYENEFKNF